MGRRRRPRRARRPGRDPRSAGESTYRRTFAQVSANVLDAVPAACPWTRAAAPGDRLVIAVDGTTVRGAKGKDEKAPHLVAALAHGTSAVLGQVAADAKSNEIPAVRELLKAFADLTGAVVTMDALHAQHDTARAVLDRRADPELAQARAHLNARAGGLGQLGSSLLSGRGLDSRSPRHRSTASA